MKDKRVLFVLIIAVVVIWGLIGYKLVVGDFDEAIITASIPMDKNIAGELEIESYQLLNNYRDPFQAQRVNYSGKSNGVEKNSNRKILGQKKSESLAWPPITFGGLIKRKNSKEKVALLKVNASDHLMRMNEEVEGIKVLKIEKDSIQVIYKSEKKVIYKK